MDYYKIPAGLLRYNMDPGEIGSGTLLAIYARVVSEGCCGESEGEDTHTESSRRGLAIVVQILGGIGGLL